MNPYLYWPNILGYFRIATAFASFFLMTRHCGAALTLYLISFLADALDGAVARLFNQCTRFGACLDMVTDRFATACLCIRLATLYPQWTIVFQAHVALDLASHYFQMFSSLSCGATSHKAVDRSKNVFVRLYYTHRWIMAILCAGNEACFIALYMMAVDPNPRIRWGWVWVASLPLTAIKQALNVAQLVSASEGLMKADGVWGKGKRKD